MILNSGCSALRDTRKPFFTTRDVSYLFVALTIVPQPELKPISLADRPVAGELAVEPSTRKVLISSQLDLQVLNIVGGVLMYACQGSQCVVRSDITGKLSESSTNINEETEAVSSRASDCSGQK